MLKFTIITICLNQKKYIGKTIRSVFRQTYRNYELIICDGKSTDGTIKIIKKYEKAFQKKNIRYIWDSKKDGGIYQAMNSGIEQASGEFCIFMNGGDFFYKNNVLEKIAKELSAKKHIDILYGKNCAYPYKKQYSYNDKYLFLRSGICHQATFIRTSLLKEHPYQYKYEIVNDYDSFLYFKFNKKTFCKTDEVIAWSLPGGLSGKNVNHTFLQELKAIESYKDMRIASFNNSIRCISKENKQSLTENLICGWWYKDEKELYSCGEKSIFLFNLKNTFNDFVLTIMGTPINPYQKLFVNGKFVCDIHFIRNRFCAVIPNFYLKDGINTFEIRSKIRGYQLINLFLDKISIESRPNLDLGKPNVLFIGHPFHKKTKSSNFIIDLFKEKYNVITEYINENDNFDALDKYFDCSFDLLVLWQNSIDIKSLRNHVNFKKSVFFPMYDGSRNMDLYSEIGASLIHSKIICFCFAMHEKFISHGFDSHYIQYFPKPSATFSLKKPGIIYLWQRIDCINARTIYKTISKKDIKQIILHRSVDPGYKFLSVDKCGYLVKKHFNKCELTVSGWYAKKGDMIKEIEGCSIYYAPREYEGIGMSFLEAMSMGKCVIAPNNPTMNEYIKNGFNGFLYDTKCLRNRYISRINLSNINEIQKNTYRYISEGYQKWNKRKYDIIKWCEEDPRPNIDLYFKSFYKKD